MLKRFIIIILAGLLIMATTCVAWAFNDTDNLSADELQAVEQVSDLGIMVGYPDDSFRPYAPVSRAELAKIISVYGGQAELAAGTVSFSDVNDGAWYYGWVNRAADEGWVNGYPGGLFGPLNPVTQLEAAAMFLRALEIDTNVFKWPDDYSQAAQDLGMFTGLSFAGSSTASRLVICLMINNLLDANAQEEAATEEEPAPLADGLYIGAVESVAERALTLYNIGAPWPLAASLRRLPQENTLIYCQVENGVVENWSLLLDVAKGAIAPTTALKRKVVKDGPYSWAATRTGKAVEAPVALSSAMPLIRYHSYRNISVGPTSLDNRNYWLGDDCQIYEAREGQLSLADRDSIEIGEAATLLVSEEDEVIVLICWK